MQNLDNATHKVVITIGSEGDSEAVGVEIRFQPEMSGEDYLSLGYQPAAHEFIERFIMPMLENVYMKSEFPELFQEDSNRMVN